MNASRPPTERTDRAPDAIDGACALPSARPQARGATVETERGSGTPLERLVAGLEGGRVRHRGIAAADDCLIRGVHQDSRRVGHGDLFVALRGAHVDGTSFIPGALERGASAVLCERGHGPASLAVPIVEVPVVRLGLARAAATVYGRPTEHLSVVGITGTNGKTTTAHFLQHALTATGRRCGIVGTLGYRFEDLDVAASHTSPEADELQRVAAQMVGRGATDLAMEVSSIALASDRVAEVRFRVGAFTNLTQDHLDYHGTMEAYAAAKDRLFFDHRPADAVIDVDSSHGAALAARLAAGTDTRVWRVSAQPGTEADLVPCAVELGAHGIRMRLSSPEGEISTSAPVVGGHNVSNLLLTLGILRALGVPLARAAAALRDAPHVAGRLERCDDPGRDDIVALVDYAHTPDALERVLRSARSMTTGQLWCVFGCGGDRDRAKRGPMGEAVGKAADRAILTNDNPRSEDPRAIADEVIVGLRAGGGQFDVQLDRAAAIERAVLEAAGGDVVLIAGKGHEPYQILGTETTRFDDREHLRLALVRRRASRGAT